jgi:hypothetical protein
MRVVQLTDVHEVVDLWETFVTDGHRVRLTLQHRDRRSVTVERKLNRLLRASCGCDLAALVAVTLPTLYVAYMVGSGVPVRSVGLWVPAVLLVVGLASGKAIGRRLARSRLRRFIESLTGEEVS